MAANLIEVCNLYVLERSREFLRLVDKQIFNKYQVKMALPASERVNHELIIEFVSVNSSTGNHR